MREGQVDLNLIRLIDIRVQSYNRLEDQWIDKYID